jgi:S-DNA-T family DNA segregation ATPase FtsK/SpoIIIE
MASKNTRQKEKIGGTNPSGSGINPQEPTQGGNFWGFMLRFERFGFDILGIILLALATMIAVGLVYPELTGGVLDWFVTLIKKGFGWGSVWVVLLLAFSGLWSLFRFRYKQNAQSQNEGFEVFGDPQVRSPISYRDQLKFPWGRIIALEFAAFASLGILALLGKMSITRSYSGLDGGIIGWGLATMLSMLLQPVGLVSSLFLYLLFTLAIIIGLFSGLGLWTFVSNRIRLASSNPPDRVQGTIDNADKELGFSPEVTGNQMNVAENSKNRSQRKPVPLPPEFRKNFKIEKQQEEKPVIPVDRDDRLPGLDLLVNENANRPDERVINQTAGLIEKTLAEFGIPARVVGFRIGPTVTQFAVEPGFLEKEKGGTEGDISRQKIRVAQIASLQRDLTLALAAERLRIEAPVPGRPYVGIEVPNTRTTLVRLRPILESEAFAKVNSPLAIVLGRDVSGQPVVADLNQMPHLLIAGTTGSGKSVCIASLAISLVMNNMPEDLRLVMIDPKMVELLRFNGLPHLLGKVETDVERILGVLRWTVAEMDRRYKLLEATRSRNIDTYNNKMRRRKGVENLPRIVLFIDELADLMMSAPDQTEHNLVRLAQMARAVGIHLIVATQRPSTDIVTGLIKANFPARIAFTVASSVDSRVILDGVGAESLLGRGDLLFLAPDSSAPIRSQGVIITDQEIQRVMNYWSKTVQPESIVPPWEEIIEGQDNISGQDELIDKAIEIIRGSQRASTSLLQRRLRIGYPRAARLMEELEAQGVVGPSQAGGKDREVLVE